MDLLLQLARFLKSFSNRIRVSIPASDFTESYCGIYLVLHCEIDIIEAGRCYLNRTFLSATVLIIFLISLVSGLFYFRLDGSIDRPESLNTSFEERAVWIMNAAWSHFPTDKRNVLTEHLDDTVTDLENNNITTTFIFVGYWNPATAAICYTMTDMQITTAINALHAKGIKVLAWAEDSGQMDIVNLRQAIYDEITNCMNKGFDGYHDDIENYTPNCTHQDYIDYLNNATTLLHGMNKLMTAAVNFDWEQNTNPYLHMDYIVSMFYSDQSKCEDPQGRWYWQENFGQYGGNNNPPASPVIMGLMNYYGNEHSLSWQLDWVTKELTLDPHPRLVGFCLWLYEYMTVSDWQTWKYWITAQ
ncbi:MAG TPA: hypothetical protein VK253_05775 [Candidatus Binatia bacterium]|nr:hypothetical protein [Candidatus Binatia bacterium]